MGEYYSRMTPHPRVTFCLTTTPGLLHTLITRTTRITRKIRITRITIITLIVVLTTSGLCGLYGLYGLYGGYIGLYELYGMVAISLQKSVPPFPHIDIFEYLKIISSLTIFIERYTYRYNTRIHEIICYRLTLPCVWSLVVCSLFCVFRFFD